MFSLQLARHHKGDRTPSPPPKPATRYIETAMAATAAAAAAGGSRHLWYVSICFRKFLFFTTLMNILR